MKFEEKKMFLGEMWVVLIQDSLYLLNEPRIKYTFTASTFIFSVFT